MNELLAVKNEIVFKLNVTFAGAFLSFKSNSTPFILVKYTYKAFSVVFLFELNEYLPLSFVNTL